MFHGTLQRSQEIYTKGLKAKRFKNIISTAEMVLLFDELEK
jgi:hypothetical protein